MPTTQIPNGRRCPLRASVCGHSARPRDRGTTPSQAGIIAAGVRLPMVVGLGPGLAVVEDGTNLIVQGNSVTIAPEQHELARAQGEVVARAARREAARGRAQEQTNTADGTRIEV